MKRHVLTGPGHHEMILLNQLKNNKVKFSYSRYYPKFTYGSSDGNELQEIGGSKIYDLISWFVWGVTNKFPILRKSNIQYDLTFPLYDYLVSLKLQDCNLLFAWPHVSLLSIKKVKKNNGIVFLDYPIPHITTWQSILREESNLLKIPALKSLFSKTSENRMLEEIKLADFISVPSIFVKNSFLENGVPERKLILNSYGIDIDTFYPSSLGNSGTFKIIFVGSIEIRKGVHYLIQAFNELKLKNAELRLIGKLHPDFMGYFEKYKKNDSIKWLGQLSKFKTAEEMRSADIMVMPSLLEGLSLTILETLASGTPVLSSENAGGLDIIREFENGFIFPIRNIDILKEKLRWCFENRKELKKMGLNGRERVISGFSEHLYGQRMVENFELVTKL